MKEREDEMHGLLEHKQGRQSELWLKTATTLVCLALIVIFLIASLTFVSVLRAIAS